MLATIPNPVLKHIKPVEPEHLVGDKIQPGHPLFGLIWINLARVSGTPCFFGTRVSVVPCFTALRRVRISRTFLTDSRAWIANKRLL